MRPLLTPIALCTVALALPAEAAPPIQFDVERTTVRAGHSRVIAFSLADPEARSEHITTPTWTVNDPDLLELTREPTILDGHRIGYLRIKGVTPGTTTLTVGDTSIDIEVEPGTIPLPQPKIVGPAPGAAVWGTITIGAQWDVPNADVAIEVANGPTLTETAWRSQHPSRDQHGAFELDTNALPAGACTLTPVMTLDGAIVKGLPITINVVQPGFTDLTVGEAEAEYNVQRPEAFGDGNLPIIENPQASGGKFVANAGAFPAVCFPLEAPTAGWYQLILRSAGTLSGGALPTVAVIIDGDFRARTNGPILSEDWHRVAIGVPFHVPAGTHVLTPYFANDFYVPEKTDRNLWVDALEVARVADDDSMTGSKVIGGEMGAVMGAMPDDDADRRQMGVMDAMMTRGSRFAEGLVGSMPRDEPMTIDSPESIRRLEQSPVRITLTSDSHNVQPNGAIKIVGSCWWQGLDDADHPPPPITELLVNGFPVAKQRAAAPTFWIGPAHLTQPQNTIQLVATLDSGDRVATSEHTLIAPPEWLESFGFRRPRDTHRFTIWDDAWTSSVRRRLSNDKRPTERVAAAFFSNGSANLELPETLEGTYHIYVEALGQHYQGAPKLGFLLEHEEGATEIDALDVPTWWGPHHVGTAEIPPGTKDLAVSFKNDRFRVGRGDRNVWIQAVSLVEARESEDDEPPTARIIYPAPGQDVHAADAVITDTLDNIAVNAITLLVDGQSTDIGINVLGGTRTNLLPLPLDHLEPGAHTIAVAVHDAYGNTTTTEPVTVNVTPEPTRNVYAQAVHVLDRFGFGADRRSLKHILTVGPRAWLESQLQTSAETPSESDAMCYAMIRFPERGSVYAVPRRALDHAIHSPHPARTRFVMWASNHFSTWIRKTEAGRKWDEHRAMWTLGATRFQDLLLASAHSPAMLRYLDQDFSFSTTLNENYAREIMELHTLGVDGGYTQNDVTQLAYLLTGWRATREGDGRSAGFEATAHNFRFDPALADPAERRILGCDFPNASEHNAEDRILLAIEMLASHPSTATFVCRKLAEHYVAVPAPTDLVNDLARTFKETDGDLTSVLLALSEHERFLESIDEPRLLKPSEYAIRLARATAYRNTWAIGDFLERSGNGVFDRPTPDGYPEEDSAYTDSNGLLQRWNLGTDAAWAITAAVPQPYQQGNEPIDEATATTIVTLLGIHLTGQPFSAQSTEAATNLLIKSRGRSRYERITAVAPLIAQLPEMNLR